MNNLLTKYIEHCENDLEWPIHKLQQDDKLIYIMYVKRNYTIENISLLLNMTVPHIKQRLCVLNI